MANTYIWKVANLERELPADKVYTVHYTVSAVSDVVDPNSANGDFYSAGTYGSVGLNGEVTIAFENLTEEVVVGWVKQALGGTEKAAEVEAALDSKISEKQTPTKATGLPW